MHSWSLSYVASCCPGEFLGGWRIWRSVLGLKLLPQATSNIRFHGPAQQILEATESVATPSLEATALERGFSA